MQTRPITQEDLDKIQALHRGDIKLPKYISDWEAKIAENQHLLAAALAQEALTPEQRGRYTQGVVKMMFRKDRLCDKWLQDIPHKTWDDLANERPPSLEDLFQYTVVDTEDCLNPPGVSTFVLFLNEHWKGFLKDFAHACLRECDPLLEEVVKLTPDVRRILSYPEQAFGTTHHDVMETRLTEWTREVMPHDAPEYVQRLLAANVMVATGNEMGALWQMEFARCEAAEPEFAQLMNNKDSRADKYLLQTQHWQIDVLLKLWPS
ncbi:MAG TPA: hypothetical protein VGP13_00040 [Candidatus Paceibacterota bacterium]|jgi:hypothetical protein|nr:hypothetical protein [Candidatus Paceibacterota bacterium]